MANASSGTLLLVIPPVVRTVNGVHEVEADFSNNLRLYLANFYPRDICVSGISR